MACESPYKVSNPHFGKHSKATKKIPVGCGKCEFCLKRKVMEWSFRLEQEAKRHTHVHFVTLTYDMANVPLTASLLPTLNKRDVQLYIKRIRKELGETRIKYFSVGEYGSRSQRPHYHILFFGVPDKKLFVNHWTAGSVHIGDYIDKGAIPYTLKYISKGGQVPAFDTDDRIPEFRHMSNGIGENFLTKQMIKHIANKEDKLHILNSTGHSLRMPRYYIDRLLKMGVISETDVRYTPEEIENEPHHSAKRIRVQAYQRDKLKQHKKI